MNPWVKLVVRVVGALVLAYLATLFYRGRSQPVLTLALAGFMVGMAYLAERLRKNREGP